MNARMIQRMRRTAIAALAALLFGNSIVLAANGAGAPLAPIQLSPERRQLIGLTFATVREKDVTDRLEATSLVEPDEQLEGYVQTRFSGWIEKVFANQTYQYVRKGEPLFTIYSPELVSTQQEYLLALKAKERTAGSDVAGVVEGADSLLDAAAERLRLWGVSARAIERLRRQRKVRHALEFDSPLSGYIIERNALPNLFVQPETRLYTIADLSRIWVYVAVFQNEAGKVRIGDPAMVSVDAYPGETFEGRVDFIWPQIDPATRTIRVRCNFDNRTGRLMPGMFAGVTLKLPMGRHLAIPDTGVLRTGTRNVVFVDRCEGYLTPREVELGPHAGNEFVVLEGLRAGDRIVSSANFLIDSESQLQAAIGTFVPPPPGAGGQTALSEAARTRATIELTTDPAAPRRGRNTVRVLLRDAQGRPLSGAEVSITFFMPAMPAMGMAAMRSQATAADQGSGNYTAQIELESGGTWQVTIRATKGGQEVAAKQLNLQATGGM